jgi:hypothetical protein
MVPKDDTHRSQPQASISGKITTDDGLSLEKARLTLIDQQQNKIDETETDAEGKYAFEGLPLDRYSIKIEKQGFETALLEELDLKDGRERMVDHSLKGLVPKSENKNIPWVGVAFWVIIFIAVGYNYFNIGEKLSKIENLQILARQYVNGDAIVIDGKLEFEGNRFSEYSVWALAEDENGNTISPKVKKVDSTGYFSFQPIPINEFGNPQVPRIIDITVGGKVKLLDEKTTAKGEAKLQLNTYQLDVVASVNQQEGKWVVEGKVLANEAPLRDLKLSVIAKNGREESYSPDTDTIFQGSNKFIMKPIPGWFVKDTTDSGAEISVHASGYIEGDDPSRLFGKQILTLGSGKKIRSIDLSIAPFIIIPMLFFFSVLLAIIEFKDNSLAFKYYSAIILAFIFTGIMIAYIVVGLRNVNKMGLEEHEEVASLGVASIYYGTYVNGVDPQWLFSLTSPSKKELNAGEQNLSKGFGAPLWVLLLSVIGAGLFTINIIVEGVKERIGSMTVDKVRTTIQKIILHEFYVFFSPIGAIFVYQLLVAGGAASQYITVAIAVLAAGLALNLLLEKALDIINKNLKAT